MLVVFRWRGRAVSHSDGGIKLRGRMSPNAGVNSSLFPTLQRYMLLLRIAQEQEREDA